MGLLAMRDRAERVGGWARVSRGEELGTIVEFWLPV
jgi:signal transduction histidine kinase